MSKAAVIELTEEERQRLHTLAHARNGKRHETREILSNVVYGGMAHPVGSLSRLLVFGRFDAVHETDAADDFGQFFGPV